jgi:methylated-DNA-[protein]-cysteine S-methyltransferase
MTTRAGRQTSRPENVRYGALKTPWGHLWVACSDKGLIALSFERQPAGKLAESLARRADVRLIRDADGLRPYGDALSAFLAGHTTKLPIKVDLRGESEFARDVYRVIRRIPVGETRSYGEVAAQVGGRNFARAVGQALGANPVPIVIPCHRVISADGGLGGFTGGGPTWKQRLLALERGQQVLGVP